MSLLNHWLNNLIGLATVIGLVAGLWIAFDIASFVGVLIFFLCFFGFAFFYWKRRGGKAVFIVDGDGRRTWKTWIRVLPVLIPAIIVGSVVLLMIVGSLIGIILNPSGLHFGTW